jgi:ATP-dependent Clp protease ATP-binding subunit ClpB
MQLEIENQALKKEKDAGSQERLKKLGEELVSLKEQSEHMKKQWSAEKAIIDRIRKTNEAIERAKLDSERFEKEGRLDKVAEIRYGTLRDLENTSATQQQELHGVQKDQQMLKEEVDEEDIAEVVAKWTGIPLSKLMQGEIEKLVRMETLIKERIVGQDDAVQLIANAVRRSRAGLADPNRPQGSFIFLGPTGVGKTYLAKSLAWFLFDDENAMIRIDMSEYMEKHSVSRLIGAPPGYVGYEEGGQLTEKIRRRPYAVILFDEIEKAHGDVFNVLLQILEDGHLTDGQGRIVNFKNTVVIMTSNVGARDIMQGKTLGFHGGDQRRTFEKMQDTVKEEMNKVFNPEFLNRLDDVIVFHPLSKEHIAQIVTILLKEVQRRLGDEVKLTPAAVEFLVEHGYDQNYGARPLKRSIQRYIEDPLSEKILMGDFGRGDEIEVDVAPDGERLAFRALTGTPQA